MARTGWSTTTTTQRRRPRPTAGDGQTTRGAHGDQDLWCGHGGAPLPPNSGADHAYFQKVDLCHQDLRPGDGQDIWEGDGDQDLWHGLDGALVLPHGGGDL